MAKFKVLEQPFEIDRSVTIEGKVLIDETPIRFRIHENRHSVELFAYNESSGRWDAILDESLYDILLQECSNQDPINWKPEWEANLEF